MMDMYEISFPVIYKYENSPDENSVILLWAERETKTMITHTGNREDSFRNAIASASFSDLERKVLNDLYRHLVLGNFTTIFDGERSKRGKSAEPYLNREYPDCDTLPEFELKSGVYNASGMVVYNLRNHHKSNKVEYRLLVGILRGLLDAEILDTPQLYPSDRKFFIA